MVNHKASTCKKLLTIASVSFIVLAQTESWTNKDTGVTYFHGDQQGSAWTDKGTGITRYHLQKDDDEKQVPIIQAPKLLEDDDDGQGSSDEDSN